MTAALVDRLGATAFCNLIGLRLRPLVGPDDAGTERHPLGIHWRATHHLSAEADRCYIIGCDARLRQQLLGSATDRRPPIGRLLFCPVGMGIVSGVGRKGAAH